MKASIDELSGSFGLVAEATAAAAAAANFAAALLPREVVRVELMFGLIARLVSDDICEGVETVGS